MGGIAGLYYPAIAKPVDPARVAAMRDAMAHRGPDGSGVWTAPGVGLGHRRLAIVDRDGGAQPMANSDQSLVVVFDGEIHNFREIRAELERKGQRFATESDTEVLLHSWRAWGPAMLDRLDGAFAFALHDAERQSLFLARDRFGVKPLHYAQLSDGAIAFASELKGLLAHPLFRRAPDFRAVEDFLGLGYVPDDASIVAGVKKLPAAHFLLVERGRPVPGPSRWWDIDFSKRATRRRRDLKAELVDRMRDAVRSRAIAGVPLGALLSDEVDDSAVIALMAEMSKVAIKTCSIGFEDDEREGARLVAERFATAHRSRTLIAEDFTLIDTLVAAFDEPFGDASALAAYRVCEFAREGMTVALSGVGADQVFAGHRRYRSYAAWESIRGLIPEQPRVRLFGMPGDIYSRAVSVTAPELRTQLYTSAARHALAGHRAEQRYVDAMREAPARGGLDRAQYADIRHALPGDILTRLDRTSMAVSLQMRQPLLDHRLAEFAATLPPRLRTRTGQGKWLMKKAMEPYLPKELLYRRDTAATAPVSAWFRGALAERAAGLARSNQLAATGWFDAATIEKLAADHKACRAEHGRTLWQLLILERSLARLFG
ncbi:asparagine synthase (glutamine-hydrolyzing) [Sphingomonas sp. DT-207]|uniref:asparagine synthase (glutamine-hydrolyzing) n=1 Tax=Sphingomonas sp. DT-207 TaxID=3396167 RepID=UPI003F1DED06